VAAQFGADIPAGLYVTNSGSSVQIFVPNVTLTSGSVTYCVQAAANGTTLPVNVPSSQISWSEPTMFRNRIINGGMVIDQRNAGTSVSAPTSGQYLVDRFWYRASNTSKFSAQQIGTSGAAAAAGLTKAFGFTSSSAYALTTTDRFNVAQSIEGYNVADLAWGTASAKSVTISFWVWSSLTGTHSGVVTNSAQTRSYPFSFQINTANTWEYKSVTIPGDTTGTWLTDNGVGMTVYWSLGVGSTLTATAGAWAAGAYYGATGTVPIVSTNGALFYITGVQLEPGTVATPFEFRPYGTELALCQRYATKMTMGSFNTYAAAAVQTTRQTIGLPVTMRATPTITVITAAGTVINLTGNEVIPSSGSDTISFGGSSVATGRCFIDGGTYLMSSEL
jgi:hypothetical protein